MKKLQVFLLKKLMRKNFSTSREISLYITLHAMQIFAIVFHIYFALVFLINGLNPPGIYNAVSILIYIFGGILLRRGEYEVFGLLFSAEMVVYATFLSVYIGTGSYSVLIYFMIKGMQMITKYTGGKRRTAVVVVSLILMAFVMSNYATNGAVATVSAGLDTLLSFSHVFIIGLGLSMQLFILGLLELVITSINKAKLSELSNQAHTDALTGLYNRHYADFFFERLSPGQYCLAMVDIDGFKEINDSLGHSCGDEVLAFLGNFLQEHLRSSDTVFRWGGEEFLLVMENIDTINCAKALEKLRQGLCGTVIPTSKGDVSITVTIGIAALDMEDIEGSISKSDENLYIGKNKTKNMIVV